MVPCEDRSFFLKKKLFAGDFWGRPRECRQGTKSMSYEIHKVTTRFYVRSSKHMYISELTFMLILIHNLSQNGIICIWILISNIIKNNHTGP